MGCDDIVISEQHQANLVFGLAVGEEPSKLVMGKSKIFFIKKIYILNS